MDDSRLRREYWMAIRGKKLKKAGLQFEVKGDVYLFREAGKPRVNFWPSTGRWLVVGMRTPQKTQSGGAEKFIAWYKNQINKEAEDAASL